MININASVMMTPRSGVGVDDDEVDDIGDKVVPTGTPTAVLPGAFPQSAAASLTTPAFARLLGCLTLAASLLLHGLTLPSSDLHFIEWIAALGHAGCSYHAICHCLTALSSWQVNLGLDSSAFTHPCMQRALKGFKQLYGITQQGQKLPITLPVLHSLLDAIWVAPALSSHDCITFTAAFTLAYACLLWCAEFTWSNLNDSVLWVGSITWSKTYAMLCLACSKTDPFRTGIDLIVPLFDLDNSATPFSHDRVISVLQQLLGQLGLPASAYASHSFRKGGATWAVLLSAPTEAIQALGHWSSNCFHWYIDHPPSACGKIAASYLFSASSTT
ncbi:hypothetical protein NDA10_003809 [Ustilago hordei]|nr:hypothetical protein NDA10_003809 [Ustilago hordei]